MTALAPFTAIAATTCQLPWFASHFPWSRRPTAIGFLSYDRGKSNGTTFDLAIRIATYRERRSLLARWTLLNVPPGLAVGWDLRTDESPLVSHLADRPLSSLLRLSRVAGLVDLKGSASYFHDFGMACDEAGIRCDTRTPLEKMDDYYTSSYERAAAGVILDTVATFRLTLDYALSEVRGGVALRNEIEMELAAGLDRLIGLAASDVPALSHLQDTERPATDTQATHILIGPPR